MLGGRPSTPLDRGSRGAGARHSGPEPFARIPGSRQASRTAKTPAVSRTQPQRLLRAGCPHRASSQPASTILPLWLSTLLLCLSTITLRRPPTSFRPPRNVRPLEPATALSLNLRTPTKAPPPLSSATACRFFTISLRCRTTIPTKRPPENRLRPPRLLHHRPLRLSC